MEQGQAGRAVPDQVGQAQVRGADFLQLDPTAAPRHGVAGWLTAAERAGITDGRLPAGTRLPATRLLAGQLGVSRGVVVEAYQRLTDEGLLSGRRGGGTTVLATAPVPQRWGLTPAPVDVDDLGLDVDTLARTQVAAVFTTPAHQYPTGVVLAPPRRRALLDWARRGGLVIEDDYDAEHRYDRAPVAALAALAPEHVVYLGSVSKTLAPALRLGWVVAPPDVREELVVRKQWSDITSPTLGQLALAELIGLGAFERHLRKVRTRQRIRRDALLGALREHLPGAHVHGVAAGLHLLVGLPEGVDDADVAELALAAGVAVQPLSYHRLRPGPPGLVIGYAATTPDRLREGVRLLATAVGDCSPTTPRP